MNPVMIRITTTQAVAERNSLVASELRRITHNSEKRARSEKCARGPRWETGISGSIEKPADRRHPSGAVRRRRQQIAEPTHGLDDVDVQLLADATDEHFDGVGVAVEVLIVEMLDQFGA